MPPKFYAAPHSRVVEEGESVYFQCAIAGVPTPWSTWDKDGLVVTQTTRLTLKERGDLRILEIQEVTFEDAGLYRITLENDYGRIEATARLDVIANGRHALGRDIRTSASPRKHFSVSRRIMGNSTKIGGRLVLASTLRGSSMPACKFYHNAEEVNLASDRIRMVKKNATVSLIIDRVTAADEGVYTCLAQNEFKISATSTKICFGALTSLEAPEFIQELEPVRVNEGDQHLDLKCIVQSDTPFDVKWTCGGRSITDTDKFW